MTPSDAATFAARLTPPGVGAIATLAVRGPRAWEVVRALFQRPGDTALPDVPEPGRVWVGKLGADAQTGRDDVVLAVMRGGPSPWLELHGHGGIEVVKLLLEVLASRGVEVVSWQECEERSGTNALCLKALDALTRAPTARTAAILLDQYAGAFASALAEVLAALDRSDCEAAKQLLDPLASRAGIGRHLTNPWRVVVAGAPNVGKSSLMNALAGYQRSVVSATPGTTRDVVTTLLAVDGWPVELADTAGWREPTTTLEGQGIALAQTAAAQADLCLWMLDASTAPVWPNANLNPRRFVINKIDLPAAWDLDQVPDAIRVSGLTGTGLGELCDALSRWLSPEVLEAGAAMPFTPRCCDAVAEALRECQRGEGGEAAKTLRGLWEKHG